MADYELLGCWRWIFVSLEGFGKGMVRVLITIR